MVRIGHDVVMIGGFGVEIKHNRITHKIKSIFKLSCNNNSCKWETLTPELKNGRYYFVAVALPDDFITCH